MGYRRADGGEFAKHQLPATVYGGALMTNHRNSLECGKVADCDYLITTVIVQAIEGSATIPFRSAGLREECTLAFPEYLS